MSMAVRDQRFLFSNFQKPWLVSKTHRGRTMPGKLFYRKHLNIKAEVNYVNTEEAKKLIAVDEYTILDVRDKSQYDRAHIKACSHVPLFIENQDNDFGKLSSYTRSRVMCPLLSLICHFWYGCL